MEDVRMTITQEQLIREISQNEEINIATVRRIFLALENSIFGYLTDTTDTNPVTIKPLRGLSLECRYIPPRHIHTYHEIDCKERIWVKPKITRYYNRKLNEGGSHGS